MNIIGEVRGKTCIIVDDLVDTAGTLCNAANALISKGGAVAVCAGATHGVLSGPALERIENSVLQEMVLLDTVPLVKNTPSCKIKELQVAPVFAEAISRIYSDRSVSPLLN
jgi:ribose-phosphate pyrophosphokinase